MVYLHTIFNMGSFSGSLVIVIKQKLNTYFSSHEVLHSTKKSVVMEVTGFLWGPCHDYCYATAQ
jgi:hypothetical protein